MPRGGARVGAGRPRKDRSSQAGQAGSDAGAGQVGSESAEEIAAAAELESLTPLDYMLRVMNTRGVDPNRRDRMAVAAAPYVHQKKGEGGKKEGRLEKAGEAGKGRFAPTATPLALVGRK